MTQEVIAVIDELGADADLLLRSDEWLENHRVNLQQQMALLADELWSVLTAQQARVRFGLHKPPPPSLQAIVDAIQSRSKPA